MINDLKPHLYFMTNELLRIDNDAEMVNMLWHHPERKLVVIDSILINSVTSYEHVTSQPEAVDRMKKIYDFINARPWGNYLWRVHETHFHTNFRQFVSCPFTCISEITEVAQGIAKDVYRS